MMKKNIQIGKEYLAWRHNPWKLVRCLAIGFSREINPTCVVNLVTIAILDEETGAPTGETLTIAARHVKTTWEYHLESKRRTEQYVAKTIKEWEAYGKLWRPLIEQLNSFGVRCDSIYPNNARPDDGPRPVWLTSEQVELLIHALRNHVDQKNKLE